MEYWQNYFRKCSLQTENKVSHNLILINLKYNGPMGSDEPPCHRTDEASSPAKWLKHCHVNLLGFMSEVGNTTLDSANCILRGTGVLALVNSVQFGNVSYIVIHHYASSCIIFHHIHLFSTYLNKIYTIYNSLKIFVMVSSDLSQT